MLRTDGALVEGRFSADRIVHGRELSGNKKTMLTGSFDNNGKLHNGSSVEMSADGSKNEIKFTNGKRTGRFARDLPGGCKYEGEWVNDLMHGKGVLTVLDGQRYEGGWVEGIQHGNGVFT